MSRCGKADCINSPLLQGLNVDEKIHTKLVLASNKHAIADQMGLELTQNVTTCLLTYTQVSVHS